MYQIEEPSYFMYLASIPVVFVMFLLVQWWKKRKQKQFADYDLIKKLSPENSTFKAVLKIVTICLALAFLIIAWLTQKWERN